MDQVGGEDRSLLQQLVVISVWILQLACDDELCSIDVVAAALFRQIGLEEENRPAVFEQIGEEQTDRS